MIGNMNGEQRNYGKIFCLAAACIAALVFVLAVFTPANIDPGNTRWVVNGGGDNLQHYLGWRFFRNSSWSRHVLFMQDLNYPAGTSVIVTDSNPLYCLAFKLFRSVLPAEFQFNGIGILCSWLLLALFSALIGWKLTRSVPLTLAGALIAVLDPVILQRALIHDTLTSHYLIAAAFWLFLNDDRRWNIPGWFILTEITLLTHIYFIPMIGFVFALQIIRMIGKKAPWTRIAGLSLVFASALLAGYYFWGYVYILPRSGSFGELSMNLNAFFNPDGTSLILRDRPSLPLQYEGYNYWGLGLLLLAGTGLLIGLRGRIRTKIPYLVLTLLLCAAAASHIAYFDTAELYHIPLPEKIYFLLSVFRSSGRLAWPVYYLVLFGSLKYISEVRRHRTAFAVFAVLCVLIQAADLSPLVKMAAERFRSPENHLADLPEELTAAIPADAEHLFVTGAEGKMTDALALYAADHRMTFNQSANARGIRPIFGGEETDLARLECSRILPRSVYIYSDPDEIPENLASCPALGFQAAGEYAVFYSE